MMKKRKKEGTLNKVRNGASKIKKTVSNKASNIKSMDKHKKNKYLKTILNVALICIILGVIVCGLFFTYVVIKAPEFNPDNLKFKEMSIVYESSGDIIAKLGDENRTEITYDDLPEVLIDAIIATEDSRFFEHNGFDLPRFLKASFGQLLGRNSGGASTLTMQIVKNNYTSTTAKGFEGIVRKFTDIYLSIFKVEKKYTKKEIIEFYINDAYLGNGAYGVEQASQNYFGKSVGELNLAEASFIAGLFQAPSSYDPYNYPDRAEARRKTVLYLMKRHGYISDEEKKIAESTPISSLITAEKTDPTYSEYQGYVDTVIEELQKKYNLNPYTTPLKIYTAMNKNKQDFINKVMNGEAWNWENDLVQAGVVMTDTDTGAVIAVGAGRNKNAKRSFNYATMTNKQIGSTAKPIFDYAPAIEYLGWGTVNYIKDEPHTYSNGTKMSNSDGGYKGILPMYQALGLSRNVTALKTFQQVSKEAGNDKIRDFAKSLGLTPEESNGQVHEAHSIGSFTGSDKEGETRNSPMTMAAAYGAFSNGGYYIEPYTITKLVYKETDEVVEYTPVKTRVMKDSTAYIINYALNWSVTNGLARSAANIGGVDVAAKTGTSNFDAATIRSKGLSSKAVNDLWVVGYTPKNAISFWYGYGKLSKEHYSTTSTWTIRDKFYRNLANNLFDKDGSTFERPASITSVEVLKNSIPLKLASSNTPADMKVTGFFRKGTEPTETSNTYDELPSVSQIKSSVSGNTINLSWKGITAEEMLKLNADESFGSLGYDIYIKDGPNGSETFVAYTTGTSYMHTTTYQNPIYVIYTTYQNYKANRSRGASHTVKIKTDFDVNAENETINVGSNFIDKRPITVLYNLVDVTSQSNIETISNNVNTSIPGNYKIEYKITYNGSSKNVSRTVTVKEITPTSSSTVNSQ